MKKSPNDADRHIGSRMRARRTSIGMSQEKLGGMLGLTFQQVQKYEKGMNRVGAGRLLDIAAILKVSVAYFYEGLPEDNREASPEDNAATLLLATTEGQRLIKAFSTITNPQLRRKVVDLVEVISAPQ
ncbi:helix-turn-helix domain-containing protein [Microvirga zambiensis]|uniref:helix-turn-helix domain-containing protein n=1 Tax=Microvirga zambiensis TaxID=1402137 RepID=UPI00191DDCDD|nr:helix-turn-helix transcriptional regulator [Microvirga zambiensis]